MNSTLNSTYICASDMWGVGIVSEHRLYVDVKDSLQASIPFSQLVLGIRHGTKCYSLMDHHASPFKPKPRYLVCKIQPELLGKP